MATITQRDVVDEIIANDGRYGSDEDGWDEPIIRIVEYNNMFDGKVAWGLIYEHEDPMRYHNSGACHNPRIIFDKVGGNNGS